MRTRVVPVFADNLVERIGKIYFPDLHDHLNFGCVYNVEVAHVPESNVRLKMLGQSNRQQEYLPGLVLSLDEEYRPY